MEKKTTSQLKKELDKIFSIYVRTRDSKNGFGCCYTCNKRVHIKQAHAGHFVSRQYLATRWQENNVKLQCVGCNVFGGGKPLDFEENLVNEIGKKKVEALKAKRHEIIKDFPYLKEIEKYKKKLAKLQK